MAILKGMRKYMFSCTTKYKDNFATWIILVINHEFFVIHDFEKKSFLEGFDNFLIMF